ncbi:adenylyl-sulfate kinase 3 isoform X2 [Euphorbia lathyris]|uniref:adenylyl-sulfate kinase 3 isoform X2 n=1 Tax=Euphorbia lathyris TaxID=212925 RepID=UPI0033136B64
MVAVHQFRHLLSACFLDFESLPPRSSNLGFARFSVSHNVLSNLNLRCPAGDFRLRSSPLVSAMKESAMSWTDNSSDISGDLQTMPCNGKSTNIVWHKSSVDKFDRQELLQQKGCVLWITGLSGSGKSTLACALSQRLHSRGKLTYVLDGDNVRHGLNSDLSFKAEDRVENIRRTGEVAKLFADAGIICIACLISPYRKDRDRCRALLPEGDFIEVFMDASLQVCEARDPKGLYKLARAGKIKGFTGIDDPYEPPLNCEGAIETL